MARGGTSGTPHALSRSRCTAVFAGPAAKSHPVPALLQNSGLRLVASHTSYPCVDHSLRRVSPRRHLFTLRNGRQTRTRALVLPTRECRCCELERGVLCEPHAASTLAHQHFCARCRSVHAACVACGGAGGVCEASNWVYERVHMCTDRKGGRGSGAYHPTSAVTPHTSLASVELLAPKQGYTR
jgi:hypothetical protein